MVEFRFARFGGARSCLDYGPLAQLAERRADNAEVGGSSPPRPTKLSVTRTEVAGSRKVGMMLSRLSTLNSLSSALRWPV